MPAASKILEFNILTKIGGMDTAEKDILSFQGQMTGALDIVKNYWVKYGQQVGLTAADVKRQLTEINRGFEMAKRTMETTPATEVEIDTGEMKIAVKDIKEIDFRISEFVENIGDLQQKFAGWGVQAFKGFTQGVTNLGTSFITTNKDLTEFNISVNDYLASLTKIGFSTKAATAITERFKLAFEPPKAPPVKYAFKVEPEIVSQLKDLTGGLATNLEAVLRVDNANMRLIGTTDTLKKAMQDASQKGLDPLADRFREIVTILEREEKLRAFSENLNNITQAARTSATPFADLRQGIDAIVKSGALAGPELQGMRIGLQNMFEEVQKRERLIDFANKLRSLGEASDITSMKQMRSEMALLKDEAQKIGLDKVVKALDLMDQEMAKGGGFIKKFKSNLVSIADTTKEKTGVETIITELEKFGKEAQNAGVDVDALIQDLRKFGIAPIAAKDSLDKTTRSLETLTQAVGVTARKSFVNLENNLKSTTQKMADTTAKSGGLAQSLSKLAFGVGGIGKLFGDMWVNMSKALIGFGVFGVARNIIRDLTQLVSGAARAVYNLTYEAAKLRDAEAAFRNIVGPAQNAGEILSRVSVASAGAIERIELVGSATRAALAGLPVERFDELVTGARALAAATGRDASDALERLTNSIAKQERRLLDELGIVIRANEVYKEYATRIGASATSLTGAQRAAAFFEAVTARVNEKVMMLGGTVDNAQIPFMRFQSSVRDLRVAFGGFLDRVLGVSETLTGMSRLMDGLSTSFSSTSEKSSKAMAALNSTELAIRTLKETVPGMIKKAEDLNAVLANATSSTDEKTEADERLKEITKALIGLFPNLAAILKDDLTEGLKQATAAAKEQLKVQQALFSLQLSKTIDANKKAFKEAREELDENKVVYDELDRAIKEATSSGEEFAKVEAAVAIKARLADINMSDQNRSLSRYRVPIDSVNVGMVKYGKILRESQDAIVIMNNDVARLVKSMIDQGEVARSDVEAFAKMDKKTANYNDTLLTLSGRLGIAKEDLDGAKESIYNLMFAVTDSGKKEKVEIEKLQKLLEDTRKKWDEFRNVIVDVDVDVEPIKRAESELESLKAERNDLVRTMIKSAGLEEVKDKATIDKMMADYQDYMYLRKNLALTEDKDLQGLYQKWRERLEAQQAIRLEELHLSEEIFDMVFDAEQEVYEKELALAKLRGQAITDEAKREIGASRDVQESEMDIAKRTLQVWEDTRTKLVAKSLWFGASEKLVLNEIAQARSRITKLEHDEMEKATKEKIKNQIEVLKVAGKTITDMQGLTGQAAIDLVSTFNEAAKDAPEQFQQIIKRMLEVLNDAVDKSKPIDAEMTDNIADEFEKQLIIAKEAYAAQAKSKEEYAEFETAINDLITQNRIKNFSREKLSIVKEQELRTDIQKEFYDLSVATNKKQADEALAGIKKRLDADKIYVKDQDLIRNLQISAENRHQNRLSKLQRDYTENTLLQIQQAKDLDALGKIKLDLDTAEAGAVGTERILTELNKREKKLIDELLIHHKNAVAKQHDLETVSARERIRIKYDNIEKEIAADEERVGKTKNNEQALKELANRRAENDKNRTNEIRQYDEKIAKETEIALMQFEKKTTDNELKEAKLRIELNFIEYEAKLENAKALYDFLAAETRALGEDYSKWTKLSANAQEKLNQLTVLKTEATDSATAGITRKNIEERAKAYKELADYIGASSMIAMKIQQRNLSAEKDAKLAQLDELAKNEKIAIENSNLSNKERADALVQSENNISNLRLGILESYGVAAEDLEREIWKKQIDISIWGSERIKNAIIESIQSISQVASEDTQEAIEVAIKGHEELQSAAAASAAAYTKPSPKTMITALSSWMKFVSTIVGYFKQRQEQEQVKYEKEITKKLENIHSLSELKKFKETIKWTKLSVEQREELEKDFNDRMESESESLAGQMASDMAEAIASGLDIPFETLLMNWIKAYAVAEIGKMLIPYLTPYLDIIKEEAGLMLDPEKAKKEYLKIYEDLKKEEIASRRKPSTVYEEYKAKELEYERLRNEALENNQTVAAQAYESQRVIYHDLAENAKKSYDEAGKLSDADEAAIKAKADQIYAEKHGAQVIKKGAEDLTKDVKEIEPIFRIGIEGLKGAVGDWTTGLDELSEQIPAATFRAVTEPQANEILVLLGQQTEFLRTIANNTTTLANRERQEKPQTNDVSAAPPIADQNININERLDITINGEAIMKINRPEDLNVENLATRLSEYQQALIDQREVALGRSKLRTRRLR